MIHRESGVFKTSYIADMAVFPLPIAQWTVAALTVTFVVVVPAAFSEYHLSIVNLIMIAVVGALGLNILVGCTGQISVGHGALMSVGAYTAANLITRLNAPFWVALPAGGAMAAAIGAVIGVPSLRIKGLYLAIATLAGQLIIEWVINHVPWISGGVSGGHLQSRAAIDTGLDHVYGLFPRLHERRHQVSGYLSGGEQQMLVVGRALMSRPLLILLDEPSLGLAPRIVDEIFGVIARLREEGMTVLLVEQNAALALEIADYAYVMENGRIVLDGPADTLRQNSDVREFYLGLNELGARKSYREVKRYRRRKRWLS